MPFLAHISEFNGKRIEQTNKQHLIETAELAREKLQPAGFGTTGYLAGLFHDMGKQKKAFTEYLEKIYRGEEVSKGSVNHTFAGAIYILERYHEKDFYECVTSEIIAYAVSSHHGIIDCLNVDGVYGLQHRLDCKKDIEYEETLANYFPEIITEEEMEDLFYKSVREIQDFIQNVVTFCNSKDVLDYMVGLTARLVLSAIVEGDRISTAEFMGSCNLRNKQATKEMWQKELTYFEKKLGEMNQETLINQARTYISNLCKQAAYRPNDIYRLSIPTGSGKTFASLRYALTHAEKYDKKRIIFVIPMLSILEQNSEVIKNKIEDSSIVLEHHSNVIHEKEAGEYMDEYELLTSNWDSPIIITTLVQLLNTLFSYKMSSIRRMQALLNSVIIIDEIQSIPSKTINLFNMAMNYLVKQCKCTVLLSSATQPCLEESKKKLILAKEPDIVPYKEELFKPFQRTIIHNMVTQYGRTIEELASFSMELMNQKSSLLIVCNTKTSALKLYNRIRLLTGDNSKYLVKHLSASMCPEHRQDVLDEVKAALNKSDDRKIICISTQMIEAGVDISFESAIRILAGMDNLAQTTGRCNRSNEYGYLCDVYLVNLKAKEENFSFLKEIEYAQTSTFKLLDHFQRDPEYFHKDLLSKTSVSEYYNNFYSMPEIKKLQNYPVKISDMEYRLWDMLSNNSMMVYKENNTFYLKQAFKTAGTLFEVFDESTSDLIVPYNEEAKRIIADLCSEQASFNPQYLRNVVEQAKRYTIHIFPYQKAKLDDMGMLFQDKEKHFMALRTDQCYSSDVGLIIDNNYIL